MKKFRAHISGVPGVALLTHNERLADPRDPIARQMKSISSKRTKTDEDFAELAKLEFEGGLYLTDDGKVGIPAWNVFRSWQEGAKVNKLGRAVERGVFMSGADILPIEYNGPSSPVDMWNAGHVDSRSVKVGMSKVTRTRPSFRNWSLVADFTVDLDVLREDDLGMIVRNAGLMSGLGDYRPRFGRYEVELEAL
jgi:hypothetical protein